MWVKSDTDPCCYTCAGELSSLGLEKRGIIISLFTKPEAVIDTAWAEEGQPESSPLVCHGIIRTNIKWYCSLKYPILTIIVVVIIINDDDDDDVESDVEGDKNDDEEEEESGGRSVCTKTECPALSCDRSMWVKSDTDPCCYTCAACFDRGQLRRNGETWHPTIQSFGFMKCVLCTCTDGSFKCEFLKCPRLTCARRKKLPNVCCEVCEDGSMGGVGSPVPQTDDKPKTVRTEKKKNGTKTKKKQKGESLGTVGTQVQQTPGQPKSARTAKKKKTAKAKKKRKACKVNGHVYIHGEKWRPKTKGLSDECAVCRCQEGTSRKIGPFRSRDLDPMKLLV
ncbi:hypothetical protein EGW08_003518 [Elysia chlorotica]|uniref:VWFC domain-containing protein n=1 Tax=Elysia chlorotica TaxID=188477 RepID=A0A433U4G3_ELYCH|nr:hypothetical protein EGW08_003518 [Elysia chlorotica]